MLSKCEICDSQSVNELLNLGHQPLANKYPRSEHFSEEKYFPLEVYFCENCKNVQLSKHVSRREMFEDYYYLSSVNLGLVRHFEGLAEKLVGANFVVDVGSNDGILLAPLIKRGVRALGVEPSVNVSEIANEKGLPTKCAFFDLKSVVEIKETQGQADVIVASSVFTHLDNPNEFVKAVKELMTEDGIFILEVEYIKNIVENLQFERFYLDRIFYYSLASLRELFKRHGMEIVDAEHIEPHGGSLRVWIRNAEVSKPSKSVSLILNEEQQALSDQSLAQFRKDVLHAIGELKRNLERWKISGLKVAGYGAPARLSTICNFGEIGPGFIAYTVDDSPLKVDRYSPGTHIPIVSRQHLEENAPDILLVFAYEYFRDIVDKIGTDYTFYKPIPTVQLRP